MFNADIKLFEIQLPKIEFSGLATMIVTGCNAYIGELGAGEHRLYSELEQNNFAYLNCNDYNGKVFELEVCLQGKEKNMYANFYARCFSIRTDNGLRIKKNGPQNNKRFSKVNMKGEVVVGIGWYLTDREYNALLSAEEILIEGFISINKVKNTYGLAVQLEKRDSEYEIKFANTYRLGKAENINEFVH